MGVRLRGADGPGKGLSGRSPDRRAGGWPRRYVLGCARTIGGSPPREGVSSQVRVRTGAGGAPDGSGAEAPGRWKESPLQVQSVRAGRRPAGELTAPALFPLRPAESPPPPGRGPRDGKEETGAGDGGRGAGPGSPAGREARQ